MFNKNSAAPGAPSASPHEQALKQVCTGRLPRVGEFVRVPTALFFDKIDVKMPVLPEVDFFVQEGADWTYNEESEPTLLKAAGQQYSALALSVHEHVLVRERDMDAIRRFANAALLKAGGISSEEKVGILRESAMLVVEDLFTHPSPENIDRSNKVVSSFVYVLMKDPKAYLHLSKLSEHDPYTLQHSVGAAVNSIILGRKLGITHEKELLDLGLGGLLHDLGKVKIRKEIINKNGPLDELEWEEMRQHSSEGFNLVKDNPQLADSTKRAILEHHENRDGSGYPGGIKYSQVHPYAKIVCLADVFNALTTNRSYSKARTPFEAFQMIRDKLQHKIEPEIFKELVLIYGGKLGD